MRDKIIIEAREWVDTPYHHQAALKGVGCDCVGLIRGVGVGVGAMPHRDADWKRFNAYGRLPNPRRMTQGMNAFLVPINTEDRKPGDIAWIEWRTDMPMHLAILAEKNGSQTIIHALSDYRKVVEHGLNLTWQERIVSWWRYPNIEVSL